MREKIISEFKYPDRKYFSKIRYWLPEAAVDPEKIKRDFQDFQERGFKGVEVIPFLNVELDRQVPEFLAWGTKKWQETVQFILKCARSYKLKIDFAIGPKWPIAMPLEDGVNDPASLYELSFGYEIIGADKNFISIPKNRMIRDIGNSKLLAVSAYQLVSPNTIDHRTYIDLTSYIDCESKINCSFAKEGNQWVVFSFWEQPAAQSLGNQWYVIDHFSAKGAEACADYWLNELKETICLYSDVVEDIFCDSLEYEVSCEWTRNFQKVFLKEKGYDILPFLPILGEKLTYPRNDLPGFQFLDTQLAKRVNNDFKALLSELFVTNHLEPLQEMANKLGMNLRYQVAYNKPLAIETAATSVAIPEGESFGRIAINNLRSMAGAVHLSGKKVYSFEGSAENDNAYGQTFEDLIWWLKRSYLGGTNSQVLHGAAYSGVDPTKNITEWPGYENFERKVSNYWNRTLSTEHMRSYLQKLARFNYILQKKHIVDLAIFRQDFLNNGKGGDGEYLLADDNLLMNHGYSYDFVSPDILKLSNSTIENGRYAPDGPNYKAIIIPYLTEISQEGLNQIQRCINANFPVIFVGKFPSKSLFQNEKKIQKIVWSKLLEENKLFYAEDFNKLLQILKEQKIYPDSLFHEAISIGTIHTQDQYGDYYYLYNYNPVKFGKYPEINKERKIFDPDTVYPSIDRKRNFAEKKLDVSFLGANPPLIMDVETGEIKRIGSKKVENRYRVSISFRGDEAKIIYLPKFQLESDSVLINDFSKQNVKREYLLEHWNLDLYSFGSTRVQTSFYEAEWSKKSSYILTTPLQEWKNLSAVSPKFAGKGVYQNKFWIDKNEQDIVFLSVDRVSDSYEIRINGHKLMPLEFYDVKIDITPYLVSEENFLEIEVYSNLFNCLNDDATKEYGLIGETKLIIC